jgi:two-component system OmpR family response regulator
MPHVTLVEDDALVRKLLEKRLCMAGWTVRALPDGRELLDRLAEEGTDLLLVDVGLPHMDGLELVERVRSAGFTMPVLVLTAFELPHLHAIVRGMGGDDLVRKPYDQEELIDRMRRLLAA